MTITYDSATIGGLNTNNPYNISHTPTGTAKGIVAFVLGGTGTATYGGVAMTEVPLSPLIKSTGEGATIVCFFLGSNIPTGVQFFSFAHGGSSHIGVVYSVTAENDTEIIDTSTISSDSLENPSETLSLSGRTCWCGMYFFSGIGSIPHTGLSNWTSIIQNDLGLSSCGSFIYDLIDSVDATFGWLQGADDAASIGIAVTEKAKSKNFGYVF